MFLSARRIMGKHTLSAMEASLAVHRMHRTQGDFREILSSLTWAHVSSEDCTFSRCVGWLTTQPLTLRFRAYNILVPLIYSYTLVADIRCKRSSERKTYLTPITNHIHQLLFAAHYYVLSDVYARAQCTLLHGLQQGGFFFVFIKHNSLWSFVRYNFTR